MMLEDRFFDQEWIQELSNEDFRMLMYLLHFASKKTGIVELNMRFINFAANTGKNYTKEEVLSRFGSMIRLVPGKESTAIFHDYIALNWAKGGKPIDVVKNPLFKSIVSELANYGMTIADLNAMSKHKITVCGVDIGSKPSETVFRKVDTQKPSEVKKPAAVGASKLQEMFDGFWAAYPSSCPRKTDKKKCSAKFFAILKGAKDVGLTFAEIMNGLEKWKKCSTWNKDDGQFIRAPLVWLNNENWKDDVVADATIAQVQRKEVKPITPQDWELCSERCAKFVNGMCLCGMKVPPTRMTPPCPPEDCRRFAAR